MKLQPPSLELESLIVQRSIGGKKSGGAIYVKIAKLILTEAKSRMIHQWKVSCLSQ